MPPPASSSQRRSAGAAPTPRPRPSAAARPPGTSEAVASASSSSAQAGLAQPRAWIRRSAARPPAQAMASPASWYCTRIRAGSAPTAPPSTT
ncbi:hypothetical protein ACFQY5_25820 [Paeniroseomonas aquatica]|uniref:hypothetical protein n=1 Tax=Paeniroseomonas aquatica TaxID=373043 RepID=UPI00360DAB4E